MHCVVDEFVIHFNLERNHQGLANQLIQPEATFFPSEGNLCRRKRLGGLLSYYYRGATPKVQIDDGEVHGRIHFLFFKMR